MHIRRASPVTVRPENHTKNPALPMRIPHQNPGGQPVTDMPEWRWRDHIAYHIHQLAYRISPPEYHDFDRPGQQR